MASAGVNIGLRAEVKKLFFDRKAVTSAVDKAQRKVLSKAGAFVRQHAVRSIRSRKGVSAPGSPPHSHTGLLKRNIFFAYEPKRAAVVIGPVRLRESQGTAPRLLELGGTVRRRDGRALRTLKYRPRSYMGPALAAEAPKFPSLFKNSVR
jgi:hypothetical protein